MLRMVYSEGEQARTAATGAASDAASASGADALKLVNGGMPGARAVCASDALATAFAERVGAWTQSLQGYATAMGTSMENFSTVDAARAAVFANSCRPDTGAFG